MVKKILITGGSGLLALNWAIHDRNDFDVILALHHKEISLKGTRSIKIDSDSSELLSTKIDNLKPDIVVHTAGLTNVELCEQNPQLAKTVNAEFAGNVALACYQQDIPLVHISTDHLFSGDPLMADESLPVSAMNIYGKTKALAEKLVFQNCPKALIIRTNFYGWGPSYRSSFSDTIINTLRQGKELNLFDDVFYTPILAEKLILTVHELIRIRERGIFNVVGDDRISKYHFGLAVAKQFDLDPKLIRPSKMKEKPELVQRPQDMSLSNNKVTLATGLEIGGTKEHLKILFEQEKLGFINEIIKL